MEWRMNERIKDVKSEYDGNNYIISGKIVADNISQADKSAYGYSVKTIPTQRYKKRAQQSKPST